MASAAPRTPVPVTLQPKWFQLFHPMGGVTASVDSFASPTPAAAVPTSNHGVNRTSHRIVKTIGSPDKTDFFAESSRFRGCPIVVEAGPSASGRRRGLGVD